MLQVNIWLCVTFFFQVSASSLRTISPASTSSTNQGCRFFPSDRKLPQGCRLISGLVTEALHSVFEFLNIFLNVVVGHAAIMSTPYT